MLAATSLPRVWSPPSAITGGARLREVYEEISTARRVRSTVLLFLLAAGLGILAATVIGIAVAAALTFLDQALA